jgi:hypothetical protein
MTFYAALAVMGLLGVLLGGVIGIFVKIFKVINRFACIVFGV